MKKNNRNWVTATYLAFAAATGFLGFQAVYAQYGSNDGAPGAAATSSPSPTGSPSVSPTESPGATPTAGVVGTVFRATLKSGEETPATTSSGTGGAVVALSGDRQTLTYAIVTTGLEGAVAAHIHVGPPGTAGPIVLTLSGPFSDAVSGTLSAADFAPAPTVGINTFDDLLNAIASGNAYVNVHTAANPNGEIRGQLTPG